MPGSPFEQEVLSVLMQVLGLAQDATYAKAAVAEAHSAFLAAQAAEKLLINATYGLSPIHADLASLRSHLDDRLDTIDLNIFGVKTLVETVISDIAALPAGLDYTETLQTILDAINGLVIPSEPPTGGEVADAVWGYDAAVMRVQPYGQNINAISALGAAYSLAEYTLGWYGWPLPGNPWIRLCTPYPDGAITGGKNWQAYSASGEPAYPAFGSWVNGDTPYTFLARTQAGFGWSLTGPGGVNDGNTAWKAFAGGPPAPAWYRSGFEAPFIQTYHTVINPPDPPVVEIVAAPVWPGVGGVTLGTPVALADQLVVTAAMDGVIVSVTTPPSKLGSYHLGGVTLDYGAGRITFETDGGELENWQYLGFREAIYTPQTMVRAAKARFQVMGGAQGTVTPWTKS